MQELVIALCSWLAWIFNGLCEDVADGINKRSALQVVVNIFLILALILIVAAVILGACFLLYSIWEWLLIPALVIALIVHYAAKNKKAVTKDPDIDDVEEKVIAQEADEVHEDLTMCVCSALIDVSDNAPIRRPRDPQSIQTSRESQWRIEGGIAYHQFEVDTSNPLNAGVIAQFQEDLQKKVNRYSKACALLLRNGHPPFVYAVKNGGNYLLIEVVLQTDKALPKIEQRRRELIKRRQRIAEADDCDY